MKEYSDVTWALQTKEIKNNMDIMAVLIFLIAQNGPG